MNFFRSCLILCVLFALNSQLNTVQAQKFRPVSAVGFSVGASNFLGDLGGTRNIGRGFVYDLNIQNTRPVFAAFYKYHLNPFIAFKGELAFTQLRGDDALITDARFFEDLGYYRRYRNLNFRSPLLSVGGMVELNMYNYEPGNVKGYKVAPYVGIGGGFFWFDPRTDDPLTGGTVRLQPLGTEGQGLPDAPGKYSLIQPQLMGSVGMKFNAGPQLALTVEVVYHHTFTDYLDDVSTNYVDPAIFFANYDPATAAQVARLHNRSGELNLPQDPRLLDITRPGEIRGDENDKDQFFRVQASFVILLSKQTKFNMYRCPVW